MLRVLAFASALVLVSLAGNPYRFRRAIEVDGCKKYTTHFKNFCRDDYMPLDLSSVKKLAKFCPAYERNCIETSGKDLPLTLIIPPPLPKGTDFSRFDLPIGAKLRSHPGIIDKQRLTAAIVASCTPDCNAVHCTVECKCANTHPKVNAMCNPPATAKMADVCQSWYSKCPMFQPLQYEPPATQTTTKRIGKIPSQ